MNRLSAVNMERLQTLVVGCCVVSVLALAPAALGAPEAVCVPWQASMTKHHFTYSGAEITLKGIARGGATEYRWDFGDGGGTGWAPVVDPYDLGVNHVYTGDAGRPFIATLHVKDAADQMDQCTYKTRIYPSDDLSITTHQDVRINMAIDAGLWWIHTNMIRDDYAAGSPGYGEPYGYWADPAGYPLPASCTSLNAFQMHGHMATGDEIGDPYVETVQRALNYTLYNTHTFAIAPQAAGDPDTNGNGIALVANHNNNPSDHRQTYIGGICMTALASSGAADMIASVGQPYGAEDYVYGRTYAEIVQDMVDFLPPQQNLWWIFGSGSLPSA